MAKLFLIIFCSLLSIFQFKVWLVVGNCLDEKEENPLLVEQKEQHENKKLDDSSSDNNGVLISQNNDKQTDTTTSNNGFVEDLLFINNHRRVVLQDTDCMTLLQDDNSLITTSIQHGHLLAAKIAALQLQNIHPECEQSIAKTYREQVDSYLNYTDLSVVLSKMDEEIHDITTTTRPEQQQQLHILSPKMDATDCWNPATAANDDKSMDLKKASMIVLEKWDLCCSQLVLDVVPRKDEEEHEKCFHVDPETMKRTRLCCDFHQESLSQLRLPVLQELSFNVRLRTAITATMTNTTTKNSIDNGGVLVLQVHQDGFLRKFDTAAVLWPTSYLLSLCIINPSYCGISDIIYDAIQGSQPSPSKTQVVSVELGAGVGLPSLAMSYLLQQFQQQQPVGDIIATRQVLATDRALHALVLTHVNSQLADLPLMVAHVEDHSNLTQLFDLKQNEHFNNGSGFSIALGSSLQSLFDYKTHDPNHILWSVLDTLLEDEESNPGAIAILSHAMDAVTPPPLSASVFECIKRINGNLFNMRTRSGDDSDFEISIYRRRRRRKGQDIKQSVSDEL